MQGSTSEVLRSVCKYMDMLLVVRININYAADTITH